MRSLSQLALLLVGAVATAMALSASAAIAAEDGAAGGAAGDTAGEVTIYEAQGRADFGGKLDKLVYARLQAVGIAPARLCSDAVFLRRAYLDLIGTLPTAAEARQFLDDKAADKRSRLVDELLERDEYADYWTMLWCDRLRVKSEFPINLWPNAVQAYHGWIRSAMAENMPYDQFVRELLTSSGSNFRVPQVNFYRAVQNRDPQSLAGAVAASFMGSRIDSWPAERRQGLAMMFSRIGFKSTLEWKEEIVYFDRSLPHQAQAVLPDGSKVSLKADDDPRQVFADWLLRGDNPWLARAAVNRIWQQLLGRGIVHPADDLGGDNRPSNPELLALLEREFVESGYDVKHIMRLIANSSTYQLSAIAASEHPRAAELFAHYPLRRLEAEVLADALCQVTGTTEVYSSAIPEPFTWVPGDVRSIALPDGSITSSFLELYGRPSRDTGMIDERNNSMGAAQRLHMLNSEHVRRKIEGGPVLRGLQRMVLRGAPRAPAELYLTVLSRYPTPEEVAAMQEYGEAQKGVKGSNAVADIVWALINSPEFIYRH